MSIPKTFRSKGVGERVWALHLRSRGNEFVGYMGIPMFSVYDFIMDPAERGRIIEVLERHNIVYEEVGSFFYESGK